MVLETSSSDGEAGTMLQHGVSPEVAVQTDSPLKVSLGIFDYGAYSNSGKLVAPGEGEVDVIKVVVPASVIVPWPERINQGTEDFRRCTNSLFGRVIVHEELVDSLRITLAQSSDFRGCWNSTHT